MQDKQNRDIAVLPPNQNGSDLVIGDPHGNLACLRAVIDFMKPGDRLIITGDLIDRGLESVGVIKELIKHREKIFSIKGNHEVLFLYAVMALENKLVEIHKKNAGDLNFRDHLEDLSALPAVEVHSKNGGQWLLRLFQQEYGLKKIYIKKDILHYGKNSDLYRIKKYLKSLPYIIHVSGLKKFHVVHADMPFNDEELFKRIKNNQGLSNEEKSYSLWARYQGSKNSSSPVFKDTGRNMASIVTFAGHNILNSSEEAFRPTNTLNLDVACYANNFSMVVNATTGTCLYISNIHTSLNSPLYFDIQERVQRQLDLWNELYKFLNEFSGCTTVPGAEELMNTWAERLSVAGSNLEKADLWNCAINHEVNKSLEKKMFYLEKHAMFAPSQTIIDESTVLPEPDPHGTVKLPGVL